MKRFVIAAVAMLALFSTMAFGQLIINEIDYDQPSTDVAEYIELAGPAGTYNNVVVDFVNGKNGTSYLTVTVGSITLTDESAGYGFYVIGASSVANADYSTGWPADNVIQNGAPDGVQLTVDGVIVDGVAYEGALNDLSGNAMEDVDTFGDDMYEGAEGKSISRAGLDSSPWAVTDITPGAVNVGQVLSADINYPPIASAGEDQTVLTFAEVILDGSATTDLNGLDDIMTYEWSVVWGSQVLTLNNTDSVIASFTAPNMPADFIIELAVTDSSFETSRDSVEIAVREPVETSLLISEYIEGSSNNKALEFYNYGYETIDLDGYSVKLSSNGTGWTTDRVMELEGTLAAGAVYVIGNASAAEDILNVSDTTGTATYFNGNDAVGLFYEDVLVDIIGKPNVDELYEVAGTASATQNHTLIRKSDSFAALTDWATSAGTNADDSHWVVMDSDYFSDLGSHSYGPQDYTFSSSSVSTVFPQAGSEIGISIDITPGDGVAAPTTVQVHYGTGGTQANTADMWLESGTTYSGIIPALTTGNVVLDYYVTAEAGAESSESSLYNMIVAGTVEDISAIHANITSYDSQMKTIEGIITVGTGILRTDRTSCYIQDESGRGLNLYANDLFTDLVRGTSVTVVGEIDLYYSTVELKDFTYRVNSTGNDLPAAQMVTVAGANNDNLEGTLTTVTGTLSEINAFTGNSNLVLTSGTDSTVVKVWESTGISTDGLTIGNDYDVTGVGSKYSDEHQLLLGYQSDIAAASAICDDCALPAEFDLQPAYPNPFNPSTTLNFSLNAAGDYTLAAFNLMGQKVATLDQAYAQAGTYTLSWDASDLSSGIYLIKLVAGNQIATQKVVLLK